MKKILVACEYTGRVRRALREKGVNAYSCDIRASLDDSEYHIQKDLKEVLNAEKWFAVISFPPCTHLASSGARHFHRKQQEQKAALEFVQMLMDYDCKYFCLENPVGIISSRIRKPDQYIQPYEYGEPVSKKTCLWLRGLLPLKKDPNQNVYKDIKWQNDNKKRRICSTISNKKKDRDKTFIGIANAMAEQWSHLLV